MRAKSLALPLLVGCYTLPTALTAAEQTAKKPNILFIFSDDHALRSIGCYGSGLNQTPNIDRLADEGARFTNSFCATSICCPSRAAILTGKHGHTNGVVGNNDKWNNAQFVFPRALQNAGYQTALVGKWHLKGAPDDTFQHWQILSGAGGQGHYFNPDFKSKDGTETRLEGYSADVITNLALDWLKQREADQPFLLMCQFKAPHIHRVPPPRYMDKYDGMTLPLPPTYFDDYRNRVDYVKHTQMEIRIMPEMLLNIIPLKGEPIPLEQHRYDWFARMTPAQQDAYHRAYDPDNRAYREMVNTGTLTGLTKEHYWYQRFIKDYLGCVAAIDDNVGRLLAYLDRHDLADNTVVIYSSDQGFFTGEHRWAEKRWMYEESFSMPFIIRWPGHIAPGTTIDALVQNIDYAPTFLDLAGVPFPDDIQGRSLTPLFAGDPPAGWRQSLYYNYDDGNAYNLPTIEGVRTTRYKLINYYKPRQAWELFDLKTDPLELNNVHDDPEYAKVKDELKHELARLRRQYKSPINTPALP
jgi:arylsulfatase A-like enzyme